MDKSSIRIPGKMKKFDQNPRKSTLSIEAL